MVVFHLLMPVSCIPVREGHPAIEATFGLFNLEMNGLVVRVDRGLSNGLVVTGRAFKGFDSGVAVK